MQNCYSFGKSIRGVLNEPEFRSHEFGFLSLELIWPVNKLNTVFPRVTRIMRPGDIRVTRIFA